MGREKNGSANTEEQLQIGENTIMDLEFDLTEDKPVEIIPQVEKPTYVSKTERRNKPIVDNVEFISCLRKENIIVRHVPRQNGIVVDPKHVLFGGMAENAVRFFTVPILEGTGAFVNVLTNQEKKFLEDYMGLEPNALSVYLKNDNYWENYWVRLTKGDNVLNLSDPSDYIKYKVLLANKDFIAPDLEALKNNFKATYQFVIVSEQEELEMEGKEMNVTMQCYLEFGKIEENADKLRMVISMVDGRPVSKETKIKHLQGQCNKLIQANPKLFLSAIKDPTLPTKVLIENCIEYNIVKRRGGFIYFSDNTPMCGPNEEPTINVAAKFLNFPTQQVQKFNLELKLKEAKGEK